MNISNDVPPPLREIGFCEVVLGWGCIALLVLPFIAPTIIATFRMLFGD